MRILLATGIYPPQIGGPATYSKLIYDELPKRGIDVDIASFGDFILKPKIIRHFLYFLELIKKGQDVDFIYAQDPVSVGLPALIASQILKKKFILKIVGDYAWEQGVQRFGVKDNLDDFSKSYQKHSVQVKTLKKVEKYVADGADLIITPSNYLKTVISNWGVDSKKIKVVYNGFRFDEIKTTKVSLRKKYNLHGTILISIGRLVPWKGFSGLVDMMVNLKKEIPDSILLIAGDGPDMEGLKSQVTGHNLQDSVIFLGRLDQKILFEYIKASDLFVLNTHYEGFSHQILETMALGTPIITTDVGGNPEAIKNNETGVLVAYNDVEALKTKAIDLIRNPNVTGSMVRKAKEKVKSFTDEKMLEELSSILINL